VTEYRILAEALEAAAESRGKLQKIARLFIDGQPSGNLTREHIVDNITLYWLTGTGASAARSYWEEGQENARAAVANAFSTSAAFVRFVTLASYVILKLRAETNRT